MPAPLLLSTSFPLQLRAVDGIDTTPGHAGVQRPNQPGAMTETRPCGGAGRGLAVRSVVRDEAPGGRSAAASPGRLAIGQALGDCEHEERNDSPDPIAVRHES